MQNLVILNLFQNLILLRCHSERQRRIYPSCSLSEAEGNNLYAVEIVSAVQPKRTIIVNFDHNPTLSLPVGEGKEIFPPLNKGRAGWGRESEPLTRFVIEILSFVGKRNKDLLYG